jgi:DNA repair protein RadC
MSQQTLFVESESGQRRATPAEILEATRAVMNRRVRRGSHMGSPAAVRAFLTIRLGNLEHEVFAVLLLDARNRLIEFVELFRGTINGASVYPREVVTLALAKNAAAVFIAHDHPSGVSEPSHADELITRRLKDALALVEIPLLDHVIIADGEAVSLAERGLR